MRAGRETNGLTSQAMGDASGLEVNDAAIERRVASPGDEGQKAVGRTALAGELRHRTQWPGDPSWARRRRRWAGDGAGRTGSPIVAGDREDCTQESGAPPHRDQE